MATMNRFFGMTKLLTGPFFSKLGPRKVRSVLFHSPKLLRATAKADLGCVQIAFTVNSDVVHPLKLAWMAAVTTPLGKDVADFARQRDDLPVCAVCHEYEFLLRVFGQHQVP